MNLIRTIFWIVLFVASTFAFLVLFEHGFSTNVAENSRKTVASLKTVFGMAEETAKANAAPK